MIHQPAEVPGRAATAHPGPCDGPFARPAPPPYVCPDTTTAVLTRAAYTVPDLDAVVCDDDRVTYADLATRVARSRHILANLGVERGDHVALCAGNGSRWVELFYALTSLGAVAVAVNTRYREEELAHVLRHSRSRFLLAAPRVLSSDILAMLRTICPSIDDQLLGPALPDLETVVILDDLQEPLDSSGVPAAAVAWSTLADAAGEPSDGESRAGHAPHVTAAEPDDVALVQYTSGTTSRPKGVLLTHRNMCLDAYFSGTRMGLRMGDRFHSVRPFFHVAGSTLSVLSSAQCLSTLVTMTRFEPGQALAVLEHESCTHFSGNDTIALMLLNHPDRPHRRLCLRGAWVAASPAIVARVVEELGAREAVVGYGQSEASPNIAQSAWYEPKQVRLSAAMRPQPGVQVRIWDVGADIEADLGARGEIQVHGWNVMRGYFDQPDKTREACTDDGWLRTGDLGVADADGRIRFVGRLKDIIRVGGENVAPAEVEETLTQHPAVKQAVVVGVPDARLVEVPFAFVIPNSQDPTTGQTLLNWLRPRIATFKMPHHIRLVAGFEDIGMTASSKIQKHKLAEHAVRLLKEAQ